MPKKGSSVKKSSPPSYCFLVDANISRSVIPLLQESTPFAFVHICEYSDTSLADEEIVAIAKRKHWIIITHDLDYGEIYYLRERGAIGVIMLRLEDQRSPRVVMRLRDFFMSEDALKHDLHRSLVIISDDRIRILS